MIRMAEVVMQYDLDESGKMVNLVRKEEIVRCKDCKHWERNDGYCYKMKNICGCDKDFYCGYAKRKPIVEYIVKETATQKEVIGKLIRCKDCKWHEGKYYCRNTDTYGFDDDDYCSLAERKTDEDD